MSEKTQSPERFEDIDWSEVSRSSSLRLTNQTKGFLGTLALIGVLILYDYFVVAKNDATFEAIGWAYNVTQLDWMFLVTLLFIGFYLVGPLYSNPRMTRYYWDRFKRNKPAVVSLIYLVITLVVGLLGPLLLSKPELSVLNKFQPPVFMTVDTTTVIQCAGEVSNGKCHGSWKYPLGTTGNGKDLLKIVVYGMQVSMKVGLMASFIVMIIGSIVGTVAAYSRPMVDEVLMRYVDIQQTFPSFLLYLLLVYVFGASLLLFILIFGFLTWGNNARYVRSNALQKTEEEYVKAAKASGAKTWYIVRRHLVPNTASSIITDLTLLIPSFILFEAGFAFLGLGDPTVPSWGQAIASGRSDLSYAPWISTIPGIFLFFTVLAFNFLGDALLDAINPQADTEADQ